MKIGKFLLLSFFFILISFPLFAKPQIFLTASQEEYFEDAQKKGLVPSKNGIYPVRLTVKVDTNDKTLYVKIYRSENAQGPFKLIIDYMQLNEEYFDLYDNEPAVPGQKYYYIAVLGKQTLADSTADQKSSVACGWGALTHETFYVFFNTTISKSYNKMTLMNKPKAMSKLGTEETTGDKSGTFFYSAKVKGLGGVAVMSYKNYSDDNIVFFNGDMITNADMFSSGIMDGSITMSGMYNGTVYFSNTIIKEGKAAGGTYDIAPKGTLKKSIPYTWNFVTEY